MTDHELASHVVRTVADALIGLRARAEHEGLRGEALGRAGDELAQGIVDDVLASRPVGDAVLSEEAVDDDRRLTSGRTWIIDPLDGTREFSEPGRVDWAVHAALVVDHRPVAGAVALPALGVALHTGPGAPAPPERRSQRLRFVVSRSRPPAWALAVADELDADVEPMGSAGAKTLAVVRGDADVYLHDGGQYEWDSCAPVAVALAAGLHASRADGSPLRYNQPNPWLPDLIVCRPELVDDILDATRRHRTTST